MAEVSCHYAAQVRRTWDPVLQCVVEIWGRDLFLHAWQDWRQVALTAISMISFVASLAKSLR